MRQAIVAVVLTFLPVPAIAQQSERVIPRVEVGLGAGGFAHPHSGGGSVRQVRIGAGITDRFGIETVLGFEGWQFDANNLDIVYTVQGRYGLSSRPGRFVASVTFGGSGTFERYRTTERTYRLPNGDEIVSPARTFADSLPPIAPTIGVAVHYSVTRRVAVRADAQAVFCPYFDGVGALLSAGVAIPIPSRRSR